MKAANFLACFAIAGAPLFTTGWHNSPSQPNSELRERLRYRDISSAGKPSDRRAIMIAEWTRSKEWTLAYIAKMPEENLGFKPVPEIRSFAEQMLHLAYWNFGFTAKCFGRSIPYQESQLTPQNYRTKATLSDVVRE